jgi:hypothetical protein
MRLSRVAPLAAACVLWTGAARAEGDAQTGPTPLPPRTTAPLPRPHDTAAESTEAYCRYVRAVATSASAVLISPQLFVTGGVVTSADVSTGVLVTGTEPRVLAGANFSVSSLVRGIHTQRIADAECSRYSVFAKLLAFSYAHRDGQTVKALEAKLAVLESSIGRADALLARAKEAFAESKITGADLDAITLRVDTLHASAGDTRGKLRATAGGIRAPSETLGSLVEQRDAAERATEQRAVALRQSQAWDLQIRGGYDQMFGIRQSVPAFGMVTLSFSPGYFWQRGADERAVAARADAARKSLETATERAELVADHLEELRLAELERLSALAPLVANLESRHRELSAVEGERARAAADSLWLALVPLRAEEAFLRAHTDDLKRVLAGRR